MRLFNSFMNSTSSPEDFVSCLKKKKVSVAYLFFLCFIALYSVECWIKMMMLKHFLMCLWEIFFFSFNVLVMFILEKAMATHSSTLAWEIWWTEQPGRLQSMELRRDRHDWATSLSLFTFHFQELEKEMATHSSVLVWRIPGWKPGGSPSMGSHRVGHDWPDLAAAACLFWLPNIR